MAMPAPEATVRIAARLTNRFALDLVKLGGFGRDVIDGLLLMAISQANVAQITRNPELQLTYATLDQVPSDDLRRPVSMSAIANSLCIPFETTRRRIQALAKLGVIQATPRGVIVPQAPLGSPFYRVAAEGNYMLVRTLYFRLRTIGLLDQLPRPNSPVFDPENPPMRIVMRLSADYLLRLAEPLTRLIGDLVTALILLDTINANTEHLVDDETQDGDLVLTQDGFVRDTERVPVKTNTLAGRLGIPSETVRRHLKRMLDADLCERTDDGFIVSSRILARDPFVQYMLDNQTHMHRLFLGLAELGVTSEWEREDPKGSCPGLIGGQNIPKPQNG